MIAGRLAIARAIATRWRSPPESCLGLKSSRWPSPTRSSAVAGELAARPERHARVEHPGGDVVDRGHRLLQVEGLEDEADLVGAQAGELAV